MREYSFDLEEKRQQEMKQLNVRKKEQYVSQTACRESCVVIVCFKCV